MPLLSVSSLTSNTLAAWIDTPNDEDREMDKHKKILFMLFGSFDDC